MRPMVWLIVGATMTGALLLWSGCGPRRSSTVPEEDLTPFQELALAWTNEYAFRRTLGGDDLVSEQSVIVERPTHQERLVIEATLFADTLVTADVERLCAEDTSGVACDSIARKYRRDHRWPERLRIELSALATLSVPFRLEPLAIYLTDEDGIDYEPVHRVFSDPVLQQQTYLDREVTRYDPYTSWEYRVYGYRHGYEYQSTGGATLYFDRINVIGKDLLNPDAKLTLVFRQDRSELGKIVWHLPTIRRNIMAQNRR